MFRARIYAQGFTVAAMVAGSFYYQKEREEQKAVDAVVAEGKAKEVWKRVFRNEFFCFSSSGGEV
jgi:hypothetical protein